MPHALEGVKLLDPGFLHRTIAMADSDLHSVLKLSAMHAAHGNTALVTRIVERGNKHLRGALNLLRGRNHLNNLI